MDTQRIKVWDRFVRVFHWSVVGLFAMAWFTGERGDWLHAWAGYGILGLVAARIVWGFVGPRHARFASFVRSPGAAMHYLGGLLTGRAARHIGHSPAGGWMIVALLVAIVLTGASGLVLYGLEGAGPMAGAIAAHGEEAEEIWEEIHEFLANFTVFLVFVHVLGVVVASLVHRENLAIAMVSGYKRADENEGGPKEEAGHAPGLPG